MSVHVQFLIDQPGEILDRFYTQNGPCCAGCDWWRWHNSVAGEFICTAPVSGAERAAMLGITWISCPIPAGHIMTPRDHYCGDFKDSSNIKMEPA